MQAQVFKIHSDFYYVKNLKHEEFVCKLREVLKKQKTEIKVGDFVELSLDNNFIAKLCKRKNSLLRPKISNIDLAVVVCSFKEPDLDFIQLDRYLTYLKYNNIKTAICFNKMDLSFNPDKEKKEIKAIYDKLGYDIFFISAKNKTDLKDLKNCIKNNTIVLLGMSGVGKTTLLNSLNPKANLKVGSVSSKTKRGCHTTRHCEIIEFDEFRVIDTPGFSLLKFDFIEPNELISLFEDIKKYSDGCKYSNCLHDANTNGICSVYDNIDKIKDTRYQSYLCFLKETKEYKESLSKKGTKSETFFKNVSNNLRVKISKRKRSVSRNTQKQKIKEE